MNASKTAPAETSWNEVIQILLRRQYLVEKITKSISHLSIERQLYIVSSYIPLDDLEEATKIICKDDDVSSDP